MSAERTPDEAGEPQPPPAPGHEAEAPGDEAEAPGQEAKAAAEEAADRVGEDLDELAEAKKERDEYLELAQRTRADFENYRKRVSSETAEARIRGKGELARELIPALDNLERALRSAGIDPEAGEPESSAEEAPSEEVSARDALAHGVALVFRELEQSLGRAGVESYDPSGEPFDPSVHEALSARAGDGVGSGIVVETVERGYRLNGQTLRPARVIVSE